MGINVFTVKLKDDPAAIDAYRRHHRDVWPEVQDSLRRAGVSRMDIHLLRRTVVMIETRRGIDCRAALKAHAASSEPVARWERLMRSLQEPHPGTAAGEWWAAMEPVFHLGGAGPSRSTEEQEPAIADVADQTRTP